MDIATKQNISFDPLFGTSNIYKISKDILLEIFLFLDLKSISKCAQVCLLFSQVIKEEIFWKEKFFSLFDFTETDTLIPQLGKSWNERFQNMIIIKNLKGCRLEARDLKYPSLICVAAVADIKIPCRKNPIPSVLITFDGWNSDYDYCTPLYSSKHLGYIGTAEKQAIILQRPKQYSGVFTWEKYLKEVKARAVPKQFFPKETIDSI